ncbi:MAG: NAD(P)H-binding protein [Pseudomonadota bacterium]
MRLLILGASHGIGRETVREALSAGHQVRALARNPGALAAGPDLEPVQGDATHPEDLRPALDGVDAVILAVGLGRDVRRLVQRTTLFSDSARALLPLMQELGPKRLLAVTGFGAGNSASAMSTVERLGHRAILGRAYADKDVQEEMIRNSNLDWTLVRPVILTNNAGTGRYKVLADPATWRNGLIARADVGHYLVRAAAEGANTREAVVLAR